MQLRWAGHAATIQEDRNSFKILTGKAKGKRSLGWPGRKWEGNIILNMQRNGIINHILKKLVCL